MLLLALAALALVAPLAWLLRCGGGWRTAALVLTRLLVAVAAFSTVATVVAEDMTMVCYNGPCTEDTAAIFGMLAGVVLAAAAALAALASVALGLAGRRAPRDGERLRDHRALSPRRLAADTLALAALVAAAVVYGHSLGTAAHTENGAIETTSALGVWLAVAAALAVAGRVSPREWFR